MKPSKSPRDYQARFEFYMGRAEECIDADIDGMLAKHAAESRLRSGSTLIAAVEIWETRSREFTMAALQEFASLIQTRAREWSRAMEAAEIAFGHHHDGARQILGRAFDVADPPAGRGGGAMKAIEARLDKAAGEIADEISAFRDGWTAPVPTRWNERHPVLFAVAMALVGAALTMLAGAATS